MHVVDVGWRRRNGVDRLALTVETSPSLVACRGCGVLATGHGRRLRRLHDIPAFGAPVELVWRIRRYRCAEPLCPSGSFTEASGLAPPGALLTTRAVWWAIGCLQRDTASVAATARRLGVDWHTLWNAIKPLLEGIADDPARYRGVEVLGVDEHIWHHSPRPGKGPKELTGMVDLTKRVDPAGKEKPQARLMDLVPGRSGPAYSDWLQARGRAFTEGVKIATLDPFRGYANAIDDELQDAVAVLDAFHVVRLGLKAMEETRRRVQQDQLGHRGHRDDPLIELHRRIARGYRNPVNYRLRMILAAGRLTHPNLR